MLQTLCGRVRRGDKAGGSDDGASGVAGGGDIRGVQVAGCCKHSVGVCDDGGKAGGEDDGTSGVAGGDDTREVQVAGCCKHAVGVCDDGDKAGGSDDGSSGVEGGDGDKAWGADDLATGATAETISGKFKSQDVANTLWTYVTMETKPGSG